MAPYYHHHNKVSCAGLVVVVVVVIVVVGILVLAVMVMVVVMQCAVFGCMAPCSHNHNPVWGRVRRQQEESCGWHNCCSTSASVMPPALA